MPLSNAQRQARFRSKQIKEPRVTLAQTKYANLPGPVPKIVGTAQIKYCPYCNPPQELKKINISEVVARKGCIICKRKFDYIRRDTTEGCAAGTYQRRKNASLVDSATDILDVAGSVRGAGTD